MDGAMIDEPSAAARLHAALRRYQDLAPEAVALRTATASGWLDVTRFQFRADALAVAAGAQELADRSPTVVLVDGGAESVPTVIGLAIAGIDILLLEAENSYLSDPHSKIHRLGPFTVIGPPGRGSGVPKSSGHLSYQECRSDMRFPGVGRDGEILQMTSGSTGEPRIVRLPLSHAVHGATTYREVFGFGADDVVLAAVPLAHSFGLIGGLLAALVSGASLWTIPRFGLRPLLAGLTEGATALLGTPAVYEMLTPVLRTRSRSWKLRTALSSGGPLSPEGAEAGRFLGTPVRQVYGSTETGLIAIQPESIEGWPSDAVGVAAPGVRLRTEPPGAEGQLFVRTPALFSGYAAGDDRAPLTEDGYYDTGDVARIDTEGRIHLVGRKSTFINVGGRKVNPQRIERILTEHSAIREVYVHGVSSPGREERIEAVVVLDSPATIAELTSFCRTRGLMPYEVPHRFHIVDRLPRTPMGKVDRQRVLAATTKSVSAVGGKDDDRVAVIGLGYVGLTLAVSLARSGARVVGVEIDPRVRAALAAKRSPLFEPGVDELLRTLPEDRFVVADSLPDGKLQTIIICVGTSVDPQTKRPDLRHLEAAAEDAAAHAGDDTLVVVRSTVPVGTCRQRVHPRLCGRGSRPLLAFCPERTIQGRALEELAALPQVIGGADERSAARAEELFELVTAERVVVSTLESAELVKLVCNAHTDLIYGFGNEVALMADALGVDGNEVIASANLGYPRPDLSRPGTVGGSCLTKDPYLLMYAAEEAGYHPPMVRAARAVNERVPQLVADHVLKALAGKGRPPADAKVFVCGIAYKGRPETDDIRGSAAVEVARVLRRRVKVLAGHDFVVTDESIAGAGFEPASIPEGLDGADALVLLVDHPHYAEQLGLDAVRSRMRLPAVVFDIWGELAPTLDGAADIEYRRLGRG